MDNFFANPRFDPSAQKRQPYSPPYNWRQPTVPGNGAAIGGMQPGGPTGGAPISDIPKPPPRYDGPQFGPIMPPVYAPPPISFDRPAPLGPPRLPPVPGQSYDPVKPQPPVGGDGPAPFDGPGRQPPRTPPSYGGTNPGIKYNKPVIGPPMGTGGMRPSFPRPPQAGPGYGNDIIDPIKPQAY